MSRGHISESSTSGAEIEEVVRFVERSRLQLGMQQLLAGALRGFCVAAVALLAAMLLTRVFDLAISSAPISACVLVLLLTFVVPALYHWPSPHEAARWIDRERGLDDRLATAIELASDSTHDGASLGRLGRLQIGDTAKALRGRGLRWSETIAPIRRDALAAVALGVMVSTALLIPGFRGAPRPEAGTDLALNGSAPQGDLDLPMESPTTVPRSVSDTEPAPTDESGESGLSPTMTPEQERDLASLAQDSESRGNDQADADNAKTAAVERIGEALGENSASQEAAELIEGGDYQGAAEELERLGEEADQLSQAARDQLAQDLDGAANDPSLSGTELGERARQAADALRDGSYEEQREALQNLGEAVEEAGENASTRQAENDGRQPGNQPGAEDGTGNGAGTGSTDGSQGGSQSGSTDTEPGQESGDGLEPGSDDAGNEQLAPGERSPRLDEVGERVEVPAQLLPGTNLSPANEPAAPESQEGESGTTQSPAGGESGDPSQVSPEQNFVPGDRRDIVRDYFNGE